MPWLLESFDEVSRQTVRINAIEIVSAEFFVVVLALLKVVANDYKTVCHPEEGPLDARLAANRRNCNQHGARLNS